RAATGGESHEDRPEFGFKLLRNEIAAMKQRVQNRAGPSCQYFWVGDQNEVAEALGLRRGAQQVGFGSERDLLQILERVERGGVEAVLLEQFAVMRRERQHGGAQVPSQLSDLPAANNRFR